MSLSPAAQRIETAVLKVSFKAKFDRKCIAAALRAAVEETIRPDPLMGINSIIYARNLLAIAAELEAQQ